MKRSVLPWLILAVILLAACDREAEVPIQSPQSTTPQEQVAAAPEPEPPTHDERVQGRVMEVPVSGLDLGAFPYFSLPEGYRAGRETRMELQRAPFWIEEGFHWVEGEVYQAPIFADPGHAFSEPALREHIDFMLTAAGGVKVAEVSGIPTHVATAAGLDQETRNRFRDGLGHFYTRPVSTYLIRQPEHEVWIHFSSFDNGASWMMARTTAFVPQGRLLSGLDLKALIDVEGRAAVQVGFDSGQAVIQPASRPQVAQIVELLRLDPALRLSVDGHTDDVGADDRNLALSKRRAEAVATALVEAGVDPSRLQTRGLGSAEPVASNATTEGRARNRRVELVALDRAAGVTP